MSLFDFVKNNLSILDVISEYVQIKPAGNYHKGPCPFHSEKEASFTVSPDKQIFYCFGCHVGGDLISFIAKIENLTQIESAKHLVDKYNLDVPDEIKNSGFKDFKKNKEEKELWFRVNEEIANWSHERLLKTRLTLDYLKERDIDLKVSKRFNVGYFPGGTRFINAFIKSMVQKGIMLKDLIDVGFLQQGNNIIYSPFEERILFPIKDVLGRFVGFGGRIFRPNDTRAKYYNSKDSDWFSKGKLLFGLDLAKKDMQKKSYAYLVEGYTDCTAMVQYGYKNVVATLGTACTVDHLKKLSRYINELLILYDGDDAGQKAILRLTQLCWEVDLDLKVVKLPVGEDPASFLKRNGQMNNLVDAAQDIFSFFVESLGKDFSSKSLSEKLKLSEKIVAIVSRIKNSFKRDLLLQKAGVIMQLPFDSLKDLMKSYLRSGGGVDQNGKNRDSLQYEEPAERSFDGFDGVTLLEEKIFSAIINSTGKNDYFWVDDDLAVYFSDKIQFLLTKLEAFIKKCSSDNCFSSFLEELDEIDKKWVLHVSLKFEQNISSSSFEQLILSFRRSYWKRVLQNIRLDILKAKQKNDEKKLKILFEEYSQLKKDIQSRGLI